MFGNWKQPIQYKQDGYNLGNGKIFMISGTGSKVLRKGKPQITNEKIDRTNIPVLIGPFYTCGNFAHGFEIKSDLEWESQDIIIPNTNNFFWGVNCENKKVTATVNDMILGELPVFIRTVAITPKINDEIIITVPVCTDDRNGKFVWFHGGEVDKEDVLYRESIDHDKLVESFEDHMLFRAAPRRIFQDSSNNYRTEDIFIRYLTVKPVCDTECSYKINEGEFVFKINSGNLNKSVNIGLVCVADTDEENCVEFAERIAVQSIHQIKMQAQKTIKKPLLMPVNEAEESGFVRLLTGSRELLYATLAEYGGNYAQGCMYPMNYIRDQYSSIKYYQLLQDAKSIRSMLDFYVAMQNMYGIQNSYDPSSVYMDPFILQNEISSEKDNEHKVAEVPSYIIIFTEIYYNMTNDIEYIKKIYKRLRYNIYCQEFSDLMLLPSPGDESYTQVVGIQFLKNFTDSNLLFLKACKFMIDIADKLGEDEDKNNFSKLYEDCKSAIMNYLWDDEKKYLKTSTEDVRGVSDVLLRQHWLDFIDLGHDVMTGCINYALDHCTNPIRVIENNTEIAAGMEVSYFLSALAKEQDPRMDECAQLLCEYTSETGLMGEFYVSKMDGTFNWVSGNQRPWETSCAAIAFYDYALGLKIDNVNKIIYLRPHNPIGWNGYVSNNIELYQEGNMKLSYLFDNNTAVFTIERENGNTDFQVEIEIGIANKTLRAISSNIHNKQHNILLCNSTITGNQKISCEFIIC